MKICELETSCKDSKLFWRKLRNLSNDENVQNHATADINPDDWYKYFSNFSNPLTNLDFFDEEFYSSVKNLETVENTGTVSLELLDCPVTGIEVKQAIKTMKLNKQAVRDDLIS